MKKWLFLFLLSFSDVLYAQDNVALINSVFTAYQTAVIDDKETAYHFNLQKNGWKIDITPFVQESEKDIQDMVQGQNENEFIFGMLELMTGKAPTRAIWKPVK